MGNTSGGSIALATNNAVQLNADFTFGGPYDLNLGTGAVTLSGSRTITLPPAISRSAVRSRNGGFVDGGRQRRLILGGANTYNSGTFILAGNVTAKDNNSPLGSGPVTMSPASGTATLNLTGTGPASAGSQQRRRHVEIILGNAANSSATALTVNNRPVHVRRHDWRPQPVNSAAIGSLW